MGQYVRRTGHNRAHSRLVVDAKQALWGEPLQLQSTEEELKKVGLPSILRTLEAKKFVKLSYLLMCLSFLSCQPLIFQPSIFDFRAVHSPSIFPWTGFPHTLEILGMGSLPPFFGQAQCRFPFPVVMEAS